VLTRNVGERKSKNNSIQCSTTVADHIFGCENESNRIRVLFNAAAKVLNIPSILNADELITYFDKYKTKITYKTNITTRFTRLYDDDAFRRTVILIAKSAKNCSSVYILQTFPNK